MKRKRKLVSDFWLNTLILVVAYIMIWGFTLIFLEAHVIDSAKIYHVNQKFILDQKGTLLFVGEYKNLACSGVGKSNTCDYPKMENISRFTFYQFPENEKPVQIPLTKIHRTWSRFNNFSTAYQSYFEVKVKEKGTYAIGDSKTPSLPNDVLIYKPVWTWEKVYVATAGLMVLLLLRFLFAKKNQNKKWMVRLEDEK